MINRNYSRLIDSKANIQNGRLLNLIAHESYQYIRTLHPQANEKTNIAHVKRNTFNYITIMLPRRLKASAPDDLSPVVPLSNDYVEFMLDYQRIAWKQPLFALYMDIAYNPIEDSLYISELDLFIDKFEYEMIETISKTPTATGSSHPYTRKPDEGIIAYGNRLGEELDDPDVRAIYSAEVARLIWHTVNPFSNRK